MNAAMVNGEMPGYENDICDSVHNATTYNTAVYLRRYWPTSHLYEAVIWLQSVLRGKADYIQLALHHG